MSTPSVEVQAALKQIHLSAPGSHKGQNGKLLLIGGSELFHAASKWSLDVASKFVDMVFYSSVPSNNDLIQQAKGELWNGIVVSRTNLKSYVEEADCILIGPGMTRDKKTETFVNSILKKYPNKKWVIDAGALQTVKPSLLNERMILTPHHQEFAKLLERANLDESLTPLQVSQKLNGVTIVLKGEEDVVGDARQSVRVAGGNAGMTKGGTGDVLAGLIAALYCTHGAWTAAIVGSYINKQAGDALYKNVGPYFNASDLVQTIPEVMWKYLEK